MTSDELASSGASSRVDGYLRPTGTTLVRPEESSPPDTVRYLIRPGDILIVSCEFGAAVVVDVGNKRVWVGWPWSTWSQHHADGVELDLPAFARGVEELWDPFQLRPADGDLAIGDHVEVGIEPSAVYVLTAEPYLPMNLLPVGREAIGGFAEETNAVDPYESPMEVILTWRPYPFMEPGDVVLDATGQRLRFDAPLLFRTEGGILVEPRWPLVLVERCDQVPDTGAAQTVTAATATGDHLDVLRQWQVHASVTLPDDADDLASWFSPIEY